MGGSKTPVNISYCGQALARLLQDDYKDLGHDKSPLNFCSAISLRIFSKYFHLYFNTLLANARKNSERKVSNNLVLLLQY